MKLICIVFVLLFASGCVWNIDQPPPEEWTLFSGKGATKEMIDLARFECGYPFPMAMFGYPESYAPLARKYGYIPETKEGDEKLQSINILSRKCMVDSGFSYRGYDICRGWTDTQTHKHVPNRSLACQPNAVIPVRSVENRINSRYCKEYPNARVCQLDLSAPYSPPKTPSSNTEKNPVEPFAPALNRQMQERQFQEQMQQQSNSQMNELLKNTTPKK